MNDEMELRMMLLYCWRTEQRRAPGITSGSRLYYCNDVNSTCKLVNINIDSDYWRDLNITSLLFFFLLQLLNLSVTSTSGYFEYSLTKTSTWSVNNIKHN
jgi:hypothetical protein